MNRKRILFGVPPHAHVVLAMDEVKAMENLGYECFTVTYGRNDKDESKIKKVIGTIRNAFRLLSRIKETNPDIIYLNSRFEPVGSIRDYITLRILKFLNGKKAQIVIKSHGSDCSILQNNSFLYKKVVVPFLTRNVDQWIFLSQEEKNIIQKHNREMAVRVYVLPNIIVPERCIPSSELKAKYHIPDEKFICLFVGRVVEVKGVFDIAESISHLRTPENFHFLFVGSGDDKTRLEQMVRNQFPNTSVQFTGYVPEAECDRFYGIADVLVYPTYDTEGFCMALFKSVACGVPVITTPIRAAKDYLSEPENVLWVKEKSPVEIANALDRIYSDNELRKTMSENNRQLGVKFSPPEVAKQFETILLGKTIKPASLV